MYRRGFCCCMAISSPEESLLKMKKIIDAHISISYLAVMKHHCKYMLYLQVVTLGTQKYPFSIYIVYICLLLTKTEQ